MVSGMTESLARRAGAACVDLAAPAAVALCQIFKRWGEQHTLCVQVSAETWRSAAAVEHLNLVPVQCIN